MFQGVCSSFLGIAVLGGSSQLDPVSNYRDPQFRIPGIGVCQEVSLKVEEGAIGF